MTLEIQYKYIDNQQDMIVLRKNNYQLPTDCNSAKENFFWGSLEKNTGIILPRFCSLEQKCNGYKSFIFDICNPVNSCKYLWCLLYYNGFYW